MPRLKGFHDWDGIKADYCTGEMTSKQLAQKWRVKESTIRQRASREEWPTPGRFKKTMDAAMKIAEGAVMQGLRAAVEDPESPEALAMSSLGQLQRAGSGPMSQPDAVTRSVDVLAYQQAMASFATRKAMAGFGRIKPPANWRELAVADTIARRALGLDSKGGGGASTMIRVTGPGGMAVDVATVSGDASTGPWEDEDED
jgi:hypothetical protein